MKMCKKSENSTDIRNITDSLNIISNLLYEVKAETPLGKTLKVLINLYRRQCETSVNEILRLSGISSQKLARLAGITEAELQQSLDYLRQKGIIIYNNTPPKSI
jgi:hypothetical protein